MGPDMSAQAVLDFWFLAPGSEGYGAPRDVWFHKNAAFDASIRERFGALIEQAMAGALRHWDSSAEGTLARIILLDQFTRNAYRGTAGAFAGDAMALAAAQELLARGADQALLPVQRWFAYMPFQHAEDAAMQEKSVALFGALNQQDASFAGALDYALRHRSVIARFGRFPHRNKILGRASTAQETDYLGQSGSGF